MQDLSSGEVTFTETRRVVFGRPAGEVLREQAEAMGALRVLLIASTSLCTRTDAIGGIEAAPRRRPAGTFHRLAPRAPRPAVLRHVDAARPGPPETSAQRRVGDNRVSTHSLQA